MMMDSILIIHHLLQNKTELLHEIGCVESLRKVASGPNGIASKYAAQTLRLIGEEVPHKLSQQVPTWSVEDVKEWIKQIGNEKDTLSYTQRHTKDVHFAMFFRLPHLCGII